MKSCKSRTINDAQNLDAVGTRQVQDQHFLEAVYPENPQTLEVGVPQSGMPTHIRLRGKQGEGVVSRYQEAVTNFGTGNCGVALRLVIKIPVCPGSDDVTIFAHHVAVSPRPSS
jgi:hypothetical protein